MPSSETQKAAVTENAQSQEQTARLKRSEKCLRELDEASLNIRPPKEENELLQEIVRLAVELVDGAVGLVYVHHPDLEQLEVGPSYKSRQLGKRPSQPRNWRIGNRLSRSNSLAWQVAGSGEMKFVNDYSKGTDHEAIPQDWDIESVIGVPLKVIGDVAGVLVVGMRTAGRQLGEQDTEVEILRRFANSASLAWQTSRLTGQAAWDLARMSILRKISDYAQQAGDLDNILHVVLSGITAGCGLGFNRAVLLFLDDQKKRLVGKIGIGELDEAEAREAWERDRQSGLRDIGAYITWIERNPAPKTPVGMITPGLSFPVSRAGDESSPVDAFSQAIEDKHGCVLKSRDMSKLPLDFQQQLKPVSDVVVVPLKVRQEVIGLLVADNKFTLHPITDDRVGALQRFVNEAAAAIDKARLLREAEVGRVKLKSLFEASGALVSSRNPSDVLDDVVERARVASEAAWVRMILVDETGRPWKHIVKGIAADNLDLPSAIRPNGISIEVIRSGKPAVIEECTRAKRQGQPVGPRA